jgi:hypothetical protein
VEAIAKGERAIYHYRRALDKLAEEPGLYPHRLFTTMFPLWRVSVRGQGRRAENYEELEWFIARAIGYAQLESVPALRDFYGLDEQLVRFVVEALKIIGHLTEGEDGILALTRLGRESLADERRYEPYESRQVLYFDAYTCHPLPNNHYRLDFFDPGDLTDEHKALYSFEPWRPEVLDELARRPDRAEYNVPDEVETLQPLDTGAAYLPMHIVEAMHPQNGPVVRVFTNVRGRRDKFFQSLLEGHRDMIAPLLDDRRPPREVIGRGLEGMDLPKGSYRLERAPDGEWRVVVPRRWTESRRPDGVERLADVGEYLLAACYCVQAWSDDVELRYRAACNKLLDRLQHIHRNLPSAQILQHIEVVFNALEVPIVGVDTLLKMAHAQGLGQALEHLESVAEEE